MPFHVETDFRGVKAIASPRFSLHRFAEQYLQRCQVRLPDFKHAIVEAPLPPGAGLAGDDLLAELLNDFFKSSGQEEVHAEPT